MSIPLPGSTSISNDVMMKQSRRRSSVLSIDEEESLEETKDAVEWMPIPLPRTNCPPGLEYLISLDELIIEQQKDILELMNGFEGNYRYQVKNNFGQVIYAAADTSTPFKRKFLGTCRKFHITVVDKNGKEVIHIYRPLRVNCWCFPCNVQILEISAPPGTVIGYVVEEWNFCTPKYQIQNAQKECIIYVKGPFCTCALCGDAVFEILARDGLTHIGKLTKEWGASSRETFTDPNNFGMNFPKELDVTIKAALIAASLLIDFMFFENMTESQKRGN